MKSNNAVKMISGVAIIVFLGVVSSVPAEFPESGQASDYLLAQVSGSQPSNATFVFSHNGESMVAGKDSWIFKLENGKKGDKLSVKAWKDDKYVDEIQICKVRLGTSCSKKGKPSKNDMGKWVEKVFINGVEKGEITVFVKPASDAPAPHKSTPFFFKGPKLKITSTVCGDKYGLTVEDYSSSQIWLVQTKNGAPRHDSIFTIPIIYNSVCNQDEGTYVNKVYSVVNGQRGTLLGSVTFTVDPLKQSCNLKINSSVIEVGDSATWFINSVPTGYSYTWIGENNGKDIESVPGTSKTNGSEKYEYSEPAIYYRKVVVNLPGKKCTTNEVKLEVISRE